MNSKKDDKQLNEIDIDSLIKSVYTKIAEWHNDDATASGLKYVTFEIIEECSNNTLKQMGLNDVVTNVKLDKDTRDEALAKKSKANSTK